MLWNSTFGHLFVKAGLSKPELGGSEPGKIGQTLLRILLGVVLLLAAAMKVHELSTTPYIAAFPPRWMMIVFTELEILFAIWLLFVPKNFEKITWLATACLFSFFGLVTLYKALSGEASCGCFGRVEINPWYTLIFDTTAVGLLLWFRPRGIENYFAQAKRLISKEIRLTTIFTHLLRGEAGYARLITARVLAVGTIWLTLAIPAAWSMASFAETTAHADLAALGQVFEGPDGKPFVVLEPEKWIGKRFSLLDYIDIGGKFREGEWIVLLYHHDCPDCQGVVSRYEQLSENLRVDHSKLQVAIVEIPPYGENASFDIACATARLSEQETWFVKTPMVIKCSQGVVTGVVYAEELLESVVLL
jgi:Methylamine utilisation protein MauE